MSVSCVAPPSALQRPLVFGRGLRRGAGPAAGLFGEIDVDNFAGGGGVGMGFELATGKAFDIAINHDEAAIAMHKANHPATRHICESVWEVNPLELCAGRPVRLAWFSPDCKHFSRAKGAKPVEKKIRGLAWVAVRWAKRVKPRLIMLENVREFMDWGPLTDEMRPCPARKGLTFKKFVGTLRGLGYEVEWKVLNAADYGAPTHRRRLFLIARRDGRGIVWPEKSHGGTVEEKGVGANRLHRVRASAPNNETPSVSAAEDTSTGATGKGKYTKAGEVRDSSRGDCGAASGLLPYRTAAECIDWSIACPSIFDRKKPLAEKTQRRIALGIIRYVLNNPRPFIVRYNGEKGPRDSHAKPVDQPSGTVVTENRFGLVTPTLMPVNHGGDDERSRSPDRPMNTLTASRGEYVCTPSLINIERSYKDFAGQAANVPLGTITACPKGGKHALVSAMIAKHYGGVVGHAPTRPLGTVTAKDHHSVVSATLVGVGGRAGQSPPCGVDEPCRTTTAKADRALVAATLTQFRGTNRGKGDVEEPAPAQTASNRPGLVYALLAKYYGNDEHGQAVDAPMHTLTAKHRHGLVTVELADGQTGVVVKVPASRVAPPGETPDGGTGWDTYIIADIGLRMLTPRELARCQGFPDSYVLTGTQSNQVARIGNSVPPQVVEALVRANFGEVPG